MARLPRLSVPGYPHHVLQRANHQLTVFVDEADRQQMLGLLAELARQQALALHAYVLMPDHFHLLLTPKTAQALPLFMQALGRRYVRYFNDRHDRRGTLWEGRYRSTVIEPESYLLACMAYIDLNPVRSALVTQAGAYAWSSYGHYAGLRNERLLTPHPLYWKLGNTPFAREAAYARRVQDGLQAQSQQALTDAVLTGWVLGGEHFVAELQKHTNRRLSKSQAGRPSGKSGTPGVPGKG